MILPAHGTPITAFNQIIKQVTPDGGTTNFWYDEKGRLLLSQNSQQATEGDVYSYTIYDDLDRIVEVGEINASVGSGIFSPPTTYPLSTKSYFDGWIEHANNTYEDVTRTHLR